MAAPLHVAYEIPNLRVGVFPANVDLSAVTSPGQDDDFQFRGVMLFNPAAGVDGFAGSAINLPSAGFPIVGVLQDNPSKNQPGDVWMQGISKVSLSGTVTPNQILAVDVNGKFLAATSGQYGVAMALSNGSTGDVVAAWVHNFGKQ